MRFEVPGKTFLVGEYAVLAGGAALGLSTKPCFIINYDVQPTDKICQLHPESPAAKYLQNREQTANKPAQAFSISDPYFGGFGRSTAEYWAAIIPDLQTAEKSFHKILKEYKSYHAGSGADLAFQYFGYVCLADASAGYFQSLDWHFENLDFFVLSTGWKLPTHEHLSTLDHSLVQDLPSISEVVIKAYTENKEFEFMSRMRDWCHALQERGLTHPRTLEMKEKLESCRYIQLAKPCGALGADVMLVFFTKNHKESVQSFLIENEYIIQAHSSDLHAGVRSQLAIQKKITTGELNVD